MHLLGTTEWFFLGYLCLVLPWAAARSRARVRPLESADPAERTAAEGALPAGVVRLLGGTLLLLLLLGYFSWVIAREWRYDLLGGRALDGRAWFLGVVTLALQLGLFAVARYWRGEEARRHMVARRLVPRSLSEWAMVLIVVLAAGFAEEAAYRDLGMLFLGILTGSVILSAAVMSLAFAAAHAVQGRKSMLVILGTAVLMHLLVSLTGTLVVAMVVHVVYDLAAVALTARMLRNEATPAGMANAA
ncbi:MAG: CPBP family intramembrane metalloprotease [Gemmatimonadetes bacterium]|nr:CPBP family intramembrane metalloprotease [Gemmatimonadota bacterium]